MKSVGRSLVAASLGAFMLLAVAGPASAVTISPSSLSFGNQTVGTSSAAQTITVTPLTPIEAVSSISTTDAQFALSGQLTGCTNNFPCKVNVTFTPTSSGAKSASVIIVTTGLGGTVANSVSLSGTGVAAPPPALPESVRAVGLPLAALVLLAGGFWFARHRRTRHA